MNTTHPFVARQEELKRLSGLLAQALSGEGQVCFVTGEAGSGKTTLLSEFARRAMAQHGDLVVATGQCDAQSGIGDAYLPFREVLGLLTGDVEAKLGQGAITEENANRLKQMLQTSGEAILEIAPDLIGMFIPWAGLVMRLTTFAAQKGGLSDKLKQWSGRRAEPETQTEQGLDQSRVFEQYSNLLQALARKQPLLLVLDDLQWADASSIALLFHIGRRVGQSRLLIVGTYRPEEVAFGRSGARHPLEKVLAELKRYHGDFCIDLDRSQEDRGRAFVDALLDSEPNLLDEGFRLALYEHTEGHALFTVELLRDMQERGDLVQDAQSRWVVGDKLDWADLPARVEGVIEERIGRLAHELREALTVASVEGEHFTAEVVAAVRDVEARSLVRSLSHDLEKQHRLISADGTQRVAGNRLSRYSFQHNLFQDYLYAELSAIDQSYLHEDVGSALESLYGDEADDIAVQLARHFTIAEIPEKARAYLRRAGEQAASRFANAEAIRHLSLALEMTPDDLWEAQYELLLAREKAHHVQGSRERQLADLTALQELADAHGGDLRQATVALRVARYAESTSDYGRAVEAARRAIHLAERAGYEDHEAAGYLQWGRAMWQQGDYTTAESVLHEALERARVAGLRSMEADCLNNQGIVAWYQGSYEQAVGLFEHALPLKRAIPDRWGEAHVLTNLAGVSYELGNHGSAIDYQQESLAIYLQMGYRRGEAMALGNLAVFLAETGQFEKALDHAQRARAICREIGDRQGETAALINLGMLAIYLGQFGQASDHLHDALAQSRLTGDRLGETQTLAYLGLLHHQLGNDESGAAHCQEALQVARQIGDQRSESQALTTLGHALLALGQPDDAAAAYRQALDLRRDAGEHHRALESLAGLARVHLAQGDASHALHVVEEIIQVLDSGVSLDGTEEPLRVILTCYQVLLANQDARAADLLVGGHELLHQRAVLIADPELRRSFLDEVPTHRELLRTWEATATQP